ncbi:unnamed protein product [Blepharisma stoltei]|uniref:Uncharacterized protein n=1 Tax=Blepharisma stoltei TaxID=1481888 RepID=A0AAU9IWG1_9CILI|nr:unnamed protein product [Blepharisma stoltei]
MIWVLLTIVNLILGKSYRVPSFDDFLQKYEKHYESTEEYMLRKRIYEENVKYIKNINNGENDEGIINWFSDTEVGSRKEKKVSEERVASYPPEWDWTLMEAVTEVKNERGCNSSYIFAAVGAVESLLYLQGKTNGTLYEMSEQVILDCDKKATCKGEDIAVPLDFMQSMGTVIEAFYPYEGNSYRCQFDLMPPDLLFNISGYRQIQPNNYTALYEAITINPVVVFMNIGSEDFFSYEAGVYGEDLCQASPLNHAMLAVGYSEGEFIKFKNSWGPNWGMEGYVLIEVNSANESKGGTCGILKYGLTPYL